MNRTYIFFIGTLATLALLPIKAFSTTIWDTGGYNPSSYPYLSTDDQSPLYSQQMGGLITISSPVLITGATWWGISQPVFEFETIDKFHVSAYSVTSGVVSLMPSYTIDMTPTRIDTGVLWPHTLGVEVPIYQYQASGLAIALTGGDYVFSVQEYNNSYDWAWMTTTAFDLPTDPLTYGRSLPSDSWHINPSTMAFNLSGNLVVVPEQSTCIGLLIGLPFIGFLIQSRKRRGK